MLSDLDRKLVRACFDQAFSARNKPRKLGLPIEATWCALLAVEGEIIGSAVFEPSGTLDPIKKLTTEFASRLAASTLYLTIEPSSQYQRLPASTEAIRASGIKRVVIGAEDPVIKFRGRGVEALRRMGITVELANGEEARLCQQLYEDYGKAANRGLPVLKLIWDLETASSSFSLHFHSDGFPIATDAVLLRVGDLSADKLEAISDKWLAIIDLEGKSFSGIPFLKEHAARTILFVADNFSESNQLATLRALGMQIYRISPKSNDLGLTSALKQLRDLGIYTVLSCGDWLLFKHAIQSGLVDTVLSQVNFKQNSSEVLSQISRAAINFPELGHSLRLLSPRVVKKSEEILWVESEAQFIR